MTADVLIHFIWPPLAFFLCLALGSLIFRRK